MALIEYVHQSVEQLQFEPLQPYQLSEEQIGELAVNDFVIVELCSLSGIKPDRVNPDSIGRLRNNDHYVAEVYSALKPSGFMGVRPLIDAGRAKGVVHMIQPGVSPQIEIHYNKRHVTGSIVTRLWAHYH